MIGKLFGKIVRVVNVPAKALEPAMLGIIQAALMVP